MVRWSIRRSMLVIAGVALVLGGGIGLSRIPSHITTGPPSPRTRCASNLRNVVMAILRYAESTKSFPAGTWPNEGLPPEKRLSWYVPICPYLEEEELDQAIDRSDSWDGRTNAPIAGHRIAIIACPVGPSASSGGPIPTPFVGIAGLGTDAPLLPKGHPRAGVFGYDRQTTLMDLKDGASCTMVVAESARVRGSWLSGGPATVRGLDTADLPYLGPGRPFGGIHPGGANVAMADGSVRFISDTVDPRIFEALSTIAGHEEILRFPLDRP